MSDVVLPYVREKEREKGKKAGCYDTSSAVHNGAVREDEEENLAVLCARVRMWNNNKSSGMWGKTLSAP